MSGFDIKAFELTGEDEGKKLTSLAEAAEKADRYEDMCKFMHKLVHWASEQKKDLSVIERNLLSVAYKNVIGALRAAWRTLNVEQHKDDALIKVYRAQIESELTDICKEALELLENILLKNTSDDPESRIFYLKMTGDYYRYLAELEVDNSGPPTENANSAKKFYSEAMELSLDAMAPTHPIRLGVALNSSVCYYEILKDKKAACALAKDAFDQAISKLDKLDERDYKDSTLIMQLLRDNLTLWTADSDQAGDD